MRLIRQTVNRVSWNTASEMVSEGMNMRRYQRILVIALAAVIVASALSFGLVKAYAQGDSALAPITPAELLTRMVDRGSTPTAVSGDISVTNQLLGAFPAELNLGGGSGPAALLQSGGGRFWMQGGKARIEAQGAFNDTVLYFDGEKATLYDSTANTLNVYSLPAPPVKETSDEGTWGDRTPFDPQTAIPQMIEKLAPVATLAVTGQEQVAGRDCYVLTLTPTAQNTLFGSLRVAVDGQTYLPLELAVFAKGSSEPAFLAGFSSISYDPIDDSVFVVPAPAGAKTEQKQLPSDWADAGTGVMGGAETALAGLEALTIEEASAKAGFDVLAAQTTEPDYAFQGAYVFDLPQEALAAAGGAAGDAAGALGSVLEGPVVVQVYGQGFGTVVMVQAKTASVPPEALQSMLGELPFIQKTTVNDAVAFRFATPLLSLMGWQQDIEQSSAGSAGPKDAITAIVVGSVSSADLAAFAASVR